MDIGIATEDREAIGKALQGVLADLYALLVMTQNLHWNLMNKEFYQFHILFETQYEALQKIIDEVAERIRALGIYVDASLEAFRRLTSVKECQHFMHTSDSLRLLIASLEGVVKKARSAGDLAEEKRDHASVDLIGRLMGELEKSCWMLRSSL